VKWDGNRYVIGTKPISFNDGKIIFDGKEYLTTRGLLSLLTRKMPIGYNDDDCENYKNRLDNSGAIYQSKHGPLKKNSEKWKNIVRPIWGELYPQRAKLADNKKAKRGSGVVYLSSDPNALVERFQLLLSSAKAGNTGVRNEIVAILDELLRMEVITRDYYKSILVYIHLLYENTFIIVVSKIVGNSSVRNAAAELGKKAITKAGTAAGEKLVNATKKRKQKN